MLKRLDTPVMLEVTPGVTAKATHARYGVRIYHNDGIHLDRVLGVLIDGKFQALPVGETSIFLTPEEVAKFDKEHPKTFQALNKLMEFTDKVESNRRSAEAQESSAVK